MNGARGRPPDGNTLPTGDAVSVVFCRYGWAEWDVSSSSTNIIGFYPARVWGWMDGWMNGYALFGSGLSLSFGLGWELSAGGIDRDPVGMTVNPIPIILLLLLSTE
ncbi:uncharacterized protein AKAW2_11049A [Aspergillus luchuensis]|uniref:Uncharacterized protein n=1 Tax=Aspergillus kawachii TaxID=1069201 RepID=A0A7R7W080_ASPKA|nr:uncharacterized protein AKAW2_11049A [Aspergillus luchuensis]BCR94003.1 hypothetical protein AKAW2_11049A [Aspergillus luchuensis]